MVGWMKSKFSKAPLSLYLFVLASLLSISCGDGPEKPLIFKPPTNQLESRYCEIKEGKYLGPSVFNHREVIFQKGERNGNYFAIGGGCIQAPLSEVWARTLTQDGISWRDAHSEGIHELTLPSFTKTIQSHYAAKKFIKWTMQWGHVVTLGTPSDPVHIQIQYQKVKGTKYIEHWVGTIDLEALSDSITSVVISSEISGRSIGVDNAAGAVGDLFENLSSVHRER
jgi:hypothetical protein